VRVLIFEIQFAAGEIRSSTSTSQPTQYKKNIDDNTVSPQGHPKPKEAPHLLSELLDKLQNFVEKIYDVRPDGHCGFRDAAFCLWGQEQACMEIRNKKVKIHEEVYLKEGTFIDIQYSLLCILATSSGPCCYSYD
ncbi:hypothetical protein VP01_872g3, partial [Puccinia sorghi]